ncbi:hypothetical protein [Christensenella minuta]|uniref:hypothetical protein n=1 Tax=Christensenella minuta TaxID=626937 RepID=UPI002A7ED6B1|nr:hypothetical protein [Christensenella minuta]MDY3751977.1 hypothetical protein [Christensenella minuta]
MSKVTEPILIHGKPLIKFHSKEIIEKFQKGSFYMQSLEIYRKMEVAEGNTIVGDDFEGMFHVNEAEALEPKSGKIMNIVNGLIPTVYSNDFAFCMFHICPQEDTFIFSDKQKEKLRGFGDTALLITDQNKFFKRIYLAAERRGFSVNHGPVIYFDESIDSFNLLVKLMRKPESFAFLKRKKKYDYQQEYRFVIHADNIMADHIELDIGDISDISEVMPTLKILNSTAKRGE